MDIISNDPAIIQQFVDLAKQRDDATRALEMERAAHRVSVERLDAAEAQVRFKSKTIDTLIAQRDEPRPTIADVLGRLVIDAATLSKLDRGRDDATRALDMERAAHRATAAKMAEAVGMLPRDYDLYTQAEYQRVDEMKGWLKE